MLDIAGISMAIYPDDTAMALAGLPYFSGVPVAGDVRIAIVVPAYLIGARPVAVAILVEPGVMVLARLFCLLPVVLACLVDGGCIILPGVGLWVDVILIYKRLVACPLLFDGDGIACSVLIIDGYMALSGLAYLTGITITILPGFSMIAFARLARVGGIKAAIVGPIVKAVLVDGSGIVLSGLLDFALIVAPPLIDSGDLFRARLGSRALVMVAPLAGIGLILLSD